jgi:L-threonylcarbamoyladenylate synthase
VKQRPRHLPLPVLLADRAQVDSVAVPVSEIAHILMEHFWPGGLTIVLPRADSFPAAATGGTDKVAVRVPDHAVPVAIIRSLGMPVIGTSANLSNEPSALTAGEVEAQLGGEVDLVVDGGGCPGGLESTVVDLTSEVPVILRGGAVPEAEIQRVYRENINEVKGNAYCSGQ